MKLAAPIIEGAAVLSLANVALADEASLSTADQPILLTDAQMDSVTAGDARVGAFRFGECSRYGLLYARQFPGR
ncbi:MAG: hypothetical protein K0S35_1930, partial [Geminicoccaceae bacterium]|nr:hypothetical protein [Geminicoccaceae bacterium]